ncbi:MAG: flippase-like domain-containing protein [Bacteroidetes bacterium]|nr:flippase-like domain-containing protein [Bacteroidota bacterium]
MNVFQKIYKPLKRLKELLFSFINPRLKLRDDSKLENRQTVSTVFNSTSKLTAEPFESGLKNKLIVIIRIITAIALIGLILYFIDVQRLLSLVKKGNVNLILSAAALVALNLYLQFLKWDLILKQLLGFTDKKKSLQSLFYGISAGIFTPLKLGEHFARTIPYKNEKIKDIIIASGVDKLFPLLNVVILGTLASIYFMLTTSESGLFDTTNILIIAVINIIVLLIVLSRKGILVFLNKYKTFRTLLEHLAVLKHIEGKFFIKALIISLLYHLTFTIQFALLLAAFTSSLNFLDLFVISNLVIFSQTVIPPIAFGEIGVREGAAVFFMQLSGFPGEAGLSASLILLTINLLIPGLIGAVSLMKIKR